MKIKIRGGNVKGVDKLHNFWAYKTLYIGIGHWTFEVLSFIFLFILMVTWGIPRERILEFKDIRRDTLWD